MEYALHVDHRKRHHLDFDPIYINIGVTRAPSETCGRLPAVLREGAQSVTLFPECTGGYGSSLAENVILKALNADH